MPAEKYTRGRVALHMADATFRADMGPSRLDRPRGPWFYLAMLAMLAMFAAAVLAAAWQGT